MHIGRNTYESVLNCILLRLDSHAFDASKAQWRAVEWRWRLVFLQHIVWNLFQQVVKVSIFIQISAAFFCVGARIYCTWEPNRICIFFIISWKHREILEMNEGLKLAKKSRIFDLKRGQRSLETCTRWHFKMLQNAFLNIQYKFY